jgi:hypothetical protein
LNEHPGFYRYGGLVRFAAWTLVVLFLGGLIGNLVHAQISDADKKKRDAFLKAREEMRTVGSPTPADAASPSGKPKPAAKKPKAGKGPAPSATDTPEPAKAPAAGKKSSDEDEDDASPAAKSKRKASPTPTKKASPASKASPAKAAATPKRATTPASDESEQSRPALPVPTARVEERTPPPRSVPVATPPPPGDLPADITVEKSGFQEEQGFEPPPPPPPRRRFSLWPFSRRPTYRYLSNNVIEAIRRAPVQRARWKFIIVHNSGTRQGNARAFDYYHRRVRRMQNGMAYHFVVGNGTSSGDGHIEIGDRWRRQINGGHVHSDYLNNISIGICLVGDFNRHRPTSAQMEATEELIKYLRERCGKAEGRTIPVRPHKEMNPPRRATDCPGDAFPYGWFRRF